jgi:hypothetical protein
MLVLLPARCVLSRCGALLLLAAFISGCSRTITHGAPPNVPRPVPPSQQPYTSAISATLSGSGVVQGGVGGGDAYGPTSAPSKPNTRFQLADSRQGFEHTKCGPTYTRSHARSEALFEPHVDSVRLLRTIHLRAIAFASGGNYETRRMKIWCGGNHPTSASASARVSGRIDFTFSPPPGIRDQLLLIVTGARPQDVTLRIIGPSGATLPHATSSDGTITVDFAQPGVYVVTASVHADAKGTDACEASRCRASQNKEVSISVQSLRDALAFGFGKDAAATGRFTATAVLPDTSLERTLRERLFTRNGRFYPCDRNCDARARDVYLTDPDITIEGGAVILTANLAGHVSIVDPLIRPRISGRVLLWGVPVSDGHMLRIDAMQLDVRSKNLLVAEVSKRFGNRLLERIQASASFDLAPAVESAKVRVAQQFPLRFQDGYCLALNLSDVRFDGMTTTTVPQPAILVYISLLTHPGTPAQCADTTKGRTIAATPSVRTTGI